ncbi:MAG TPA: RNA polymerase sigma factor [Verrucomicrobiae bacterium]
MAGIGPAPHWCERLYRAKAAELILYGRALGLSHGEAEDVLHETFAALLHREVAPETPARYVVRSFRNHALNHRRSLWRRLTREFESARWFEPAPDESPAERAAMRCLADLPPAQREVVVLKVWHEHTFEEIGQLLGVSPHTAAGRYRYGLEKLRACLKGQEYEFTEPNGRSVPSCDPEPASGLRSHERGYGSAVAGLDAAPTLAGS